MRPLEARVRSSAWNPVDLTAEDLRRAQHRQHQVDQLLTFGRLPQHVQPVANLRILDFTQPAVDMEDELVEDLVVRRCVQAKIVIQLRGLDQCPDLPRSAGALAGSIALTCAYSSSSCSSRAMSP